MPTLSAKDVFSRPSSTTLRGLQTRAGTALTRPTENLCSRRTRKATAAFASHEENGFVFSRSQRSFAPNNHRNSESELYTTVAKRHVSEGNTRRLLEKETRFFCVRCIS